MSRLALIIMATAASGMAVTTHARKAPDDLQVRRMAARYATCVVQQSSKEARRFVLEGDAPPPISGMCLNAASESWGGQMRFPDQNYRYALAGALLARDFPNGVPAGLKDADVIEHPAPTPLDESKMPANIKEAAELRATFSRRRSVWALDLIGECIARADAPNAYALARSEIGASEGAAMDSLKAAIGGCLPENTTLRLNPGLVRGAITVNLYRLAHSARTPDHA